jgi:hypothetical protein
MLILQATSKGAGLGGSLAVVVQDEAFNLSILFQLCNSVKDATQCYRIMAARVLQG